MSTLEERLRSPGPKRILALDGGGVRGIVSLAILERIEAILRERAPPPGSGPFRLAHYFDLIGGTSTGSIIAAGLALGFSVDEIRSLLALSDEPERDCAEAAAIARRHLQDIETRIARLETLRDALSEVAVSCEGGRARDCRVIEAIAGTDLPVAA